MIWGQWLGNKQQKFKKLRIIGICSVNKKQGTGGMIWWVSLVLQTENWNYFLFGSANCIKACTSANNIGLLAGTEFWISTLGVTYIQQSLY